MPTYLKRDTLILAEGATCPYCGIGCVNGVAGVNCVINPDMSAVVDVPCKYWKLTGDVVSEMSAGEKSTKDSTLATAHETARRKSHPTAPGSIGIGFTGTTTSNTSAVTLYVEKDAASRDMLVNKIEVETSGTGPDLMFGSCSGDPVGTIKIRNVVTVSADGSGQLTKTGFTPFMILAGERFWIYSGLGSANYPLIKRVSADVSLGYWLKTIAAGSIVENAEISSLTESSTYRLRVKAISE